VEIFNIGDIVCLTDDCDDSVYRDSDGKPIDVQVGDEIELLSVDPGLFMGDGMYLGRVLRSGDLQGFHWSELELVHRPVNSPSMYDRPLL